IVVFPSYLFHDVAPYYGAGTRITVRTHCWFARGTGLVRDGPTLSGATKRYFGATKRALHGTSGRSRATKPHLRVTSAHLRVTKLPSRVIRLGRTDKNWYVAPTLQKLHRP